MLVAGSWKRLDFFRMSVFGYALAPQKQVRVSQPLASQQPNTKTQPTLHFKAVLHVVLDGLQSFVPIYPPKAKRSKTTH